MRVRSLGREDPLEEGMATHSSILAWRIPWTEEPGGLQFTGPQRVGYNWSDLARSMHIIMVLGNFCLGKWSRRRNTLTTNTQWDGPRQIETIGHLTYGQRAWEQGTGLQTCILNEGYDRELHLLLNKGTECFFKWNLCLWIVLVVWSKKEWKPERSRTCRKLADLPDHGRSLEV